MALCVVSVTGVLVARVAQTPAPAASARKPSEPTVGQSSKDVLLRVPSPDVLVGKICDMAQVAAERLRHRPRVQ